LSSREKDYLDAHMKTMTPEEIELAHKEVVETLLSRGWEKLFGPNNDFVGWRKTNSNPLSIFSTEDAYALEIFSPKPKKVINIINLLKEKEERRR
jgi:hypothetical protein